MDPNASIAAMLGGLGAPPSSGSIPLASGINILPSTPAKPLSPCDAMKADPSYSGLFGNAASYGGLVNTSVTPSSWTDDQRNTAITIGNNTYKTLSVPALQAMSNSALAKLLQCSCPTAVGGDSARYMSTPPSQWSKDQRNAAITAVGTSSASVQPNEQLFARLSCSTDNVPGYCGTTSKYDADSKTTRYALVGNCPGSGGLHFS